MENAPVRGSANDAACRLHDSLHARVKVDGVVPIAITAQLIEPLAHPLVHRIDLWQTHGGDERTDESSTGQVYAFTKRATQHRKGYTLSMFGKGVEKALLIRLSHTPLLHPHRNVRVHGLKLSSDLLQIVMATKERQIVAWLRCKLPGHDANHRRQ